MGWASELVTRNSLLETSGFPVGFGVVAGEDGDEGEVVGGNLLVVLGVGLVEGGGGGLGVGGVDVVDLAAVAASASAVNHEGEGLEAGVGSGRRLGIRSQQWNEWPGLVGGGVQIVDCIGEFAGSPALNDEVRSGEHLEGGGADFRRQDAIGGQFLSR